MRKELLAIICLYAFGCMGVTCRKQSATTPHLESSLVNSMHLDYLYTSVEFSGGKAAAGIYIYSQAPDYIRVADADEGFTCVDDVARAVQFYVRNKNFSSDTIVQNKCFQLVRFILEMQSANGYFYNFLLPDMTINKSGVTSTNSANWWSWRALYALSEAEPVIELKDPQLAGAMRAAISNLITRIKTDLVPLPKITKTVGGFTVPTWLPAESGTDQAAIMILGLIPYCLANSDSVLNQYLRTLAEGIALMQQGDTTHFPYSCILSWENTWHAYGADQALALMKAGEFLKDDAFVSRGISEVANFFPWLLQNGMKSSFVIENTNNDIRVTSDQTYVQIAYGIRPIVTAAVEAYNLTGEEKYADMAGHFAAWFFGANAANENMYSSSTGRCFDGIESSSSVNRNAGAESTIEALLALQAVENVPAARSAMDKYKK